MCRQHGCAYFPGYGDRREPWRDALCVTGRQRGGGGQPQQEAATRASLTARPACGGRSSSLWSPKKAEGSASSVLKQAIENVHTQQKVQLRRRLHYSTAAQSWRRSKTAEMCVKHRQEGVVRLRIKAFSHQSRAKLLLRCGAAGDNVARLCPQHGKAPGVTEMVNYYSHSGQLKTPKNVTPTQVAEERDTP